MEKKINLFIQARQKSIRFPNKIFAKINNRYVFKLIFDRMNLSKKVNKIFYLIPKKDLKLKKKLNEFPSSSIIVNASNEILVDMFLRKKIPFLGIFKGIKTILNNRNYKKYAIRKPKKLSQIKEIDHWARNITMKNLIRK